MLAVTQPIILSQVAPVVTTPIVSVSPLTARIEVRLQRPTTAVPLAWDANTVLRVSVVLIIDGVEHRYSMDVPGGVLTDRSGADAPASVLVVQPTYLLGPKAVAYLAQATPDAAGWVYNVPTQWRTELASAVSGRLEVALVKGVSAQTVLLLAQATDGAAPLVKEHRSVTFDAATSAQALNASQLSLAHTSSGLDRAVFAGVGTSASSPNTISGVTYGGVSMTQQWSLFYTLPSVGFWRNGGYTLAGQSTGSQTVTVTLAGANDELALGVVSMNGVDGTTPVGTPATATGFSSNPSVTVSGVGVDDLVVDMLYMERTSLTVGADQTVRNTQDVNGNGFRQSTQPGTAGGVMSWSSSLDGNWGLGAIAFKPVSGAAATKPIQLLQRGQAVPRAGFW